MMSEILPNGEISFSRDRSSKTMTFLPLDSVATANWKTTLSQVVYSVVLCAPAR